MGYASLEMAPRGLHERDQAKLREASVHSVLPKLGRAQGNPKLTGVN
jgi:hypothetical protein